MSKPRREVKSVTFNELHKLLSLQISLTDAENLLYEEIQRCDHLIEEDVVAVRRRQASEQEYRLQCLHEERERLDDDIHLVRESLDHRKEQVRQRRLRLSEARALHEEDLLTEFDVGSRLAEDKKHVRTLKKQIEPVRTSLLSTVAFIFPIELLSPPDLLYTILSVPLPIPPGGTEPAPPLALLKFPSVNEDSVATALGYAALVVHLMAKYLCRGLTYPITYVGSRTLIKDPISAMMGPRMFPLYSRGVETYRFEYAVFLLNKDIELLMADRNLRALDLRHTLPNLKNLLLTLTSGDVVHTKIRPLPSPSVISISTGLQSPKSVPANVEDPPPLSLDDRNATPKQPHPNLPSVDEGLAQQEECSAEAEGDGPSSQESTGGGTDSATPTVRSLMPRIQIQSYLPPLSSIWRTRTPSSQIEKSEEPSAMNSETSPSGSTSSVSSDATAVSTEASGSQIDNASACDSEETSDNEDEDDRQTVRGAYVPTTPVAETRSDRAFGAALDSLKQQIRGTGGHATKELNSKNMGSEKHVDVAALRTPPLTR